MKKPPEYENIPDNNFDSCDGEDEFFPCSVCDGHPACEDFGCAIELGMGRMVKKNIYPGFDDWI